jgi:hypothetical protein
LASELGFSLFYEDAHKVLRPLGHSQHVISKGQNAKYVQRLKLLDIEGDLGDIDISGAVLRLRLPESAVHLANEMIEHAHGLSNVNEVCHNFKLSVRAENRDANFNDAGESIIGPTRLMRIRWEGEEVDENIYDPASRLTATLEFDRNMKNAF